MPLPLQQIGAIDAGRHGRTSTSPAPGRGTGLLAMRRTSGPPGGAMSMQRMDSGMAVMASSSRLAGGQNAQREGVEVGVGIESVHAFPAFEPGDHLIGERRGQVS